MFFRDLHGLLSEASPEASAWGRPSLSRLPAALAANFRSALSELLERHGHHGRGQVHDDPAQQVQRPQHLESQGHHGRGQGHRDRALQVPRAQLLERHGPRVWWLVTNGW